MKITSQLQKPVLKRLIHDYENLCKEMNLHAPSKVNALLNEAEANILKLRNMDHPGLPSAHSDHSRNAIRSLKLEYRFLLRRWKRKRMSQERYPSAANF